MRKTVSTIWRAVLVLAVCVLCAACGNGAKATTMNLAQAEGRVNIWDEDQKELDAIEDMGLYSCYQMETRKQSYAWINLDKVKLADGEFNGIVNVTVYIEPIVERNLTLAQSNITLINLPEGLEWEFTHEQETYRLRISGLDDAVSAVNQAEVKGTIDIGAWMADRNVEELTPGEYEMPVAFTLPGNVEQENEVRVRVNIRELNEIENGQNEGEE